MSCFGRWSCQHLQEAPGAGVPLNLDFLSAYFVSWSFTAGRRQDRAISLASDPETGRGDRCLPSPDWSNDVHGSQFGRARNPLQQADELHFQVPGRVALCNYQHTCPRPGPFHTLNTSSPVVTHCTPNWQWMTTCRWGKRIIGSSWSTRKTNHLLVIWKRVIEGDAIPFRFQVSARPRTSTICLDLSIPHLRMTCCGRTHGKL